MIREAKSGDEGAILDFVQPHMPTSMFLASNLLTHGLFEREHRHGTEFWIFEKEGCIAGVLGVTMQGYVVVQCPHADPAVWQAFADRVRRRMFNGVTGDPQQVEHLIAALGILQEHVALDALDPLMHLELDQLPDAEDNIRSTTTSDMSQLIGWWQSYVIDAQLKSPDDPSLREDALRQAKASIDEDRTRILMCGDEMVSMSSINARVGNTVQVGGVFTPKHLRRQGFAGRVISAQLRQERRRGTQQAILFAASETATRAYQKVGFSQIGHYRLFLMKEPLYLGGSQ